MADYFFESSSLAKAYVAEVGTDWVRKILDQPQHRIFISALAEVEVVSALTRRFNDGDLTREQLDQACDDLRQDCAVYLNVDVQIKSSKLPLSMSAPISFALTMPFNSLQQQPSELPYWTRKTHLFSL